MERMPQHDCEKHLIDTKDGSDGYGHVFQCTVCNRYYIKTDSQINDELGLPEDTRIAEVRYKGVRLLLV